MLGILPIKDYFYFTRKSTGKRKINSAIDTITEKVAKPLKLTKCDLDNTTIVGNQDAVKENMKKAAQFDHLMSLIKRKVLSCKTSCEKIQYLILWPYEWSIDKCSDYFQVSQYLIWKSRDFAKEMVFYPCHYKRKGNQSVMKWKKRCFQKVLWRWQDFQNSSRKKGLC